MNELTQTVSKAYNFKDLLHTELQLGMSEFVCRHGTLSDGFDKITPAQKYYQAIKESYQRALEIKRTQAMLKKAEAKLIRAEAQLDKASEKHERLDAESEVELAQISIVDYSVHIRDTERQLNAFMLVVSELQAEVRKKYPKGIEQAELDNWTAVAKYKALKRKMGEDSGPMSHIPLPEQIKGKIGMEYGAPEMAAAWMVEHHDETAKKFITGGNNV